MSGFVPEFQSFVGKMMRLLRARAGGRGTKRRLDDDALYATWLVLTAIEVVAIIVFGIMGNLPYPA